MSALVDAGPVVLAVLGVALVVAAACHAILHTRDHRAAIGWVGAILALPLVGAAVYWMLGINRVQRKATALYRDHARQYPMPVTQPASRAPIDDEPGLVELAGFMDKVTDLPLMGGNLVTPLENGDEAYPAMLAAIEGARRSVALGTYIFDRDAAGLRFVEALARATRRGVAVRVLIDAVGARYSFPSVISELRQRGIRAARFNRTVVPWRWTYANLRNHRKVLVVDGAHAFTGGLNIRGGHVLADAPRHPVVDLHFAVRGPVTRQLVVAFAEDWHFVTGERLEGSAWFPSLVPAGDMLARAIIDGPDADLDKLRWTVLGAITCAHRRVRIQTPYFLPEADLTAALNLASLRGVDVEILIPAKNNQWLVAWACAAHLPQVLERGCRVLEIEGAFDHSKVMVVDDRWVLLGSANLDPRSLRLNFELNVEVYSEALATRIHAVLDAKLASAREVTLERLASRSLPRRLRDGFARLFTPYL